MAVLFDPRDITEIVGISQGVMEAFSSGDGLGRIRNLFKKLLDKLIAFFRFTSIPEIFLVFLKFFLL